MPSSLVRTLTSLNRLAGLTDGMLMLVGGAVIDLATHKTPKDYDLAFVGSRSEAFIDCCMSLHEGDDDDCHGTSLGGVTFKLRGYQFDVFSVTSHDAYFKTKISLASDNVGVRIATLHEPIMYGSYWTDTAVPNTMLHMANLSAEDIAFQSDRETAFQQKRAVKAEVRRKRMVKLYGRKNNER